MDAASSDLLDYSHIVPHTRGSVSVYAKDSLVSARCIFDPIRPYHAWVHYQCDPGCCSKAVVWSCWLGLLAPEYCVCHRL